MSIHTNTIQAAYIQSDIYEQDRLSKLKEFTPSEYGYSCFPSHIYLTLSEPTYGAVECMKAVKMGKKGYIEDCSIKCIVVGTTEIIKRNYSELESGYYFKVTNPQWIEEFIRKHNEILNEYSITI